VISHAFWEQSLESFEGISEKATIYPNVILGNNVTVFPGAVLGRPPMSSGAARKIDLSKLKPLLIGDNCIIGANAVIYMGTKIGANTMVCDTACIREGVEIGEYSLIAMGVTINCNTSIGNRVKIMDNAHITGNMVIEDNVFIGMLVTSANDNSMNRSSASMEEMLGPTIKEGAIIGQGACLFPSIIIGRNATIGANSVVTKNVGEGVKVMGVPAKPIIKG
jgi:acetyltransferase-like isoleucine patch superfamily enzyme